MGVRMNRNRNRVAVAFAGLAVICFCAVLGAQALTAPKFKFDPDWPKPLPNKWKLGGVTGLAVDKDDNVWVLNRPNDLTDIELEAEIGIADCCVRPPSMIHFDKQGNVIGSFDAPQGHGMAVDSKGQRLYRRGFPGRESAAVHSRSVNAGLPGRRHWRLPNGFMSFMVCHGIDVEYE